MNPGGTFQQKLKQLQAFSHLIPGMIIIRRMDDFCPVFISEKGLKSLGKELTEIQAEPDNFQNAYFHNEDLFDYREKLAGIQTMAENTSSFSFFQQIKLAQENEWIWHSCSAEIFHRDEQGKSTHIITIANPVNHLKHLPNKLNRLVAENLFFKQNLEKFLLLGKREKEVLRLVALGKSSAEIAEELFISFETVNTPRKNIKEKLKITSNYGFAQYAQAFDLY